MAARPAKQIPQRMGFRLRRPAMGSSVTAGVLWALYGGACAAADDEIGEIIVTATRHAVSAQDVPASITAISGDALDIAGIKDIAGLAHSVAGVNYVDKGPYGGTTGSTLVIRGLNSEDTSNLAFPSQIVAPVATYVDETPLFANHRCSRPGASHPPHFAPRPRGSWAVRGSSIRWLIGIDRRG
jgi:outer membrane receptor protein involved in Fe transport